MAHEHVWNIELAPGVKMPFVGLGTYKASAEEMAKTVNEALDLGYRHFDGADYYQVCHFRCHIFFNSSKLIHFL